MINEKQKKTTQKYRDNYDAIFRKKPINPLPEKVVGSGGGEGGGVADEGKPGPDPLGSCCNKC